MLIENANRSENPCMNRHELPGTNPNYANYGSQGHEQENASNYRHFVTPQEFVAQSFGWG